MNRKVSIKYEDATMKRGLISLIFGVLLSAGLACGAVAVPAVESTIAPRPTSTPVSIPTLDPNIAHVAEEPQPNFDIPSADTKPDAHCYANPDSKTVCATANLNSVAHTTP